MVDDNKTINKFGYSISTLSEGSKKPICVKCDYCQSEYEVINKNRVNSNKILNKDACNSCKYIKRKEVSLISYGVENSAQRDDVREKLKENSDRLKSEEFKKASRETMLKKYGVEYALQNKKIYDKYKETMIGRWGVDSPAKSDEIRNKIAQTNIDRYGYENYLSSPEARRKIEETNLVKYGVKNVFEVFKNGGDGHHFKDPIRAAINGQKSLDTKKSTGAVKLYNGKTISEIRKDSEYSDSAFRSLINKYGLETAISMTPKISSLELAVRKILDDNNIAYSINQSVGGYKPDLVVGDLIIECDGLYYHSETICKNKNYHVNKKAKYKECGYRSLFFREDEILNKLDIVKSIILNKLGKSTKIFARKCTHSTSSPEFFVNNHLMGRGAGKCYSLSFGGEVVASMQIKRVGGNNYEISRYCTKLGVNVVGGFTKILARFVAEVKPSSITTFIDCRYGEGSYLESLGFAHKSFYPSFKWTNHSECFHRMKFCGNSGYEAGLVKIWDCGQAKYMCIF